MNEYELSGQSGPERNFWSTENKILLGATAVAIGVGPIIPAVEKV